MNKLIDGFKEKMKENVLFEGLPVNKKIIGKNANISIKETLNVEESRIEMWEHETYVLDNLPSGTGNLSLPEEEFSFVSTEQKRSKYFLKCNEIGMESDDCIAKEKTVLTFIFKATKPMVVHFKVDGFRHKIYLKIG